MIQITEKTKNQLLNKASEIHDLFDIMHNSDCELSSREIEEGYSKSIQLINEIKSL